MVTHPRLERGTPWLKVRCSTDWANRPYKGWWARVDSNYRPHAYQACALTDWATSPYLVRMGGFEPSTPWSQTMCATKLRHIRKWQGWQDSNPRHVVLETTVLPTELHPHINNIWMLTLMLTFWDKLILKNGGPSGTRTPDLPVMSRTL